jgi:tRNA dimethylallyltransferase
MSGKPTVVCIVGPTACGKTALSVNFALAHSGEIVSADAVAVYKELNIGSAKPTVAERKGVPHHMIDCTEITDEAFTVSVFRDLAREAIDGIVSRGKLPIVVGGSGLYLDSVFADMRFSAPSDPVLRASIEKDYDLDSNAVFEALKAADPASAERLHPNDKKRIVRALEVFRITGKPFSELNRSFETAQTEDGTYRVIRVGLNTDRKTLYARIDRRVEQMMRDGLLEEAYTLFDRGFTPNRYRAMQSIGYAQLYDAYCGNCSVFDAVETIKLDTRHFAKRQITWFKRNRNTLWLDPMIVSQQDMIQKISELIYGNQ